VLTDCGRRSRAVRGRHPAAIAVAALERIARDDREADVATNRLAEADEVYEAAMVGLHAVEYMAARAAADCKTFGHLLAGGLRDDTGAAERTFAELHTSRADFLRELLDRVDALMQFAGDHPVAEEPSADDVRATTHAFRRVGRVRKKFPAAVPTDSRP
jgi:hypothetical protein